ncbi:IS66 C-terminal element [Pseudomonas mucidolens]|uniref:IS66 C-terminal element n=1 Tax=Pseudomonas mucidolens TaxID=46679 RepID=A0A1H2LPU4_9PSED|nr:IS66 C-terminal element [Pseudomonas mucidolens]
MNGHDPYAYLKDVLTRLPTQRTREIGPLLPVATGSNGSFSTGHGHGAYWTNP